MNSASTMLPHSPGSRQNPTPPASSNSYASSFDDAERPDEDEEENYTELPDEDDAAERPDEEDTELPDEDDDDTERPDEDDDTKRPDEVDTELPDEDDDDTERPDEEDTELPDEDDDDTERPDEEEDNTAAERPSGSLGVSTAMNSASTTPPHSPGPRQNPPVGRRDCEREGEVRGKAKMRSRNAEPGLMQLLATLGSFVMQVFENAFWMIKTPLTYAVVSYLLAVFVTIGYRYTGNLLLSTVCRVPGISILRVPFCEDRDAWGIGKRKQGPTAGDLPRLIDLQENLESVLESSNSGDVMTVHLQFSRVAVGDLSKLVERSGLDCRDELLSHLNDFKKLLRTAGRSLQHYSSHAHGLVRTFLAMDAYVLHLLENARRASASSTSDSPIAALLLSPFRSSYDLTLVINDIFAGTSWNMVNSINQLISEGQKVISELAELEYRLKDISSIAHNEKVALSNEQEAVLAEIWIFLRRNKKKHPIFRGNLALLENIVSYLKQARAIVAWGLLKLQQINSDINELNERVREPLSDEDPKAVKDSVLPLEVHIGSIRDVMERMKKKVEESKVQRIKGIDAKQQEYMEATSGY